MDQIRRSFGVCPQTNILFDELTCQEHLELVATLKGVQDHAIVDEVNSMISKVRLITIE